MGRPNKKSPFPGIDALIYIWQRQQPVEDVAGASEEEVNEVEEEEMEEVERCEAEFNFQQFVADFAHPEIVKCYAALLAEFATNSDQVNHCVVKMLHRISHDLGFIGMLFQASIFKTFSHLLHGPFAGLARYKELSKFACYVVRQFTTIAQTNKKVFVDLMFWKNKNEALAITSNYDFTSKSSSKVSWTEHDEQELSSLFEKFRHVHHPEKDTVDLIMGELTSSHTRLQVLKELKKQGLITSVKDIHKPKTSRQRQVWTEEELAEVRQLFEEFKESNYPISDIMKSYNGSKGRSAVLNKLLELNLVDDKSQLLKKRNKKSGERSRTKQEESGESEEENSNDDDRSGSDSGDVSGAQEHSTLSVSVLAKKIVDSGYKNQLAWIQRGLRNTAEDRDEGVCVPTPLVALTEENETAMEDDVFLNFLRSLGISPPSNEQEVFWRIPSEYSASELRKIADCLELTACDDITSGNEIQDIVKTACDDITSGNEIQDIVARVFPNKASQSKMNGKEKKLKKKQKDRKHSDVPKAKKAKDIKSSSASEEESLSMFVPVIPRVAKGSDTSDSGLDSELEAKEQKAIWLQKREKKSKHVTTEERKNALKRMMERRKERKSQTGKNNIESDNETAPEMDVPKETSDQMHKAPREEDKNNETANTKESDSESDTSSLSSLSDDQSQPNNDPSQKNIVDFTSEKSESNPVGSRLAAVKTRKRFLGSDSGSDPDGEIAEEATVKSKDKKMKRVRMLSSDDDEEQGKPIESQQEESFKLHFSSSEDEDDESKSTSLEKNAIRESQSESTVKTSADSFPATLLTQGIDSDEEDDHVPLRTAIKRKRAITDSDED
ncbi:protein timeless [Biomphalaria glabrata]|nr:protein timeless [Biomphalaria glabrata]